MEHIPSLLERTNQKKLVYAEVERAKRVSEERQKRKKRIACGLGRCCLVFLPGEVFVEIE